MRLFKNKDKEESHPLLPSGAWEGFYCYDTNSEQHKMAIELNFKNTVISGSGNDDVASFTWKGKYDLDVFKVFMTKTYSTHRVFYMGTIDENGIYGKWKISMQSYNFPKELTALFQEAFQEDCNGGFHIWPKKLGEESNANEESQNNESAKLKEIYVEVFN